MKTLILVALTIGILNFVQSQPPGSPKNMPGSDTSTVESDAGKMRDKKERSDTASQIPKRQKKVK